MRRTFDSEEAVGRWVLASNVARRHLTVSQRIAFGERLREREEKAARERMAAGGRLGGQSKGVEHVPPPSSTATLTPDAAPSTAPAPLVSIALPPRESRKARDEAGKAAGVSGRMLDQMRAVRREAAPEVVRAVEEGRLAVSAAVTLKPPGIALIQTSLEPHLVASDKRRRHNSFALTRHPPPES